MFEPTSPPDTTTRPNGRVLSYLEKMQGRESNSKGRDCKMTNFVKTDDILKDMCGIIDSSREAAYRAVNTALIQRNWLIGYRIAEEEMKGEDRAEYGAEVIKKLAKELTKTYGKGFDYSSLYKFVRFYKAFPNILDSLSPKSSGLLSWTHYRVLLQVEDKQARDWYEKESVDQTWSVRTLQRNISSQYYYRMLQTQKPALVETEMKERTVEYQNDNVHFEIQVVPANRRRIESRN